jgi:hypothetical protein
MPTVIDPNTLADPTKLDQLDSQQAADLLKEFSVQIAGKSGTLNLVKNKGKWELRRQNAFSRFFNFRFQADLEPAATTNFLRGLINKATPSLRPGPQHHLAILLNGKESVDAAALDRPLGDALTTKRGELSVGESARPLTEQQLCRKLGWPPRTMGDDLESYSSEFSLGSGSFGTVASIGNANGQRRVVKLEKDPKVVHSTRNPANPRGCEFAAAYLFSHKTGTSVPGVAVPTHFIFKDNSGQFYHVPAQRTKAFLRQMQNVTLRYCGQVLPRAEGQGLDKCLGAKDGVSAEDKREIARQMHQILTDLAARGFIHHDIKPGNFVWDAKDRRLTLVDTGMIQKLSKHEDPNDPFKQPLSRHAGGTYATSHPHSHGKVAHSSSVDAFSVGATLLMMHLTGEEDRALREKMFNNFGPLLRVGDEELTRKTDNYLEAWLSGESFENEPRARALLENIGPEEDWQPTVEDYAHRLMQASFLPPDRYKIRLEELAEHPYLKSN